MDPRYVVLFPLNKIKLNSFDCCLGSIIDPPLPSTEDQESGLEGVSGGNEERREVTVECISLDKLRPRGDFLEIASLEHFAYLRLIQA